MYSMKKEKAIKHLDKLIEEIASIKLESLKDLIKKTPNDTDLGREVRKYFSGIVCTK
jgi:hypothetical protein